MGEPRGNRERKRKHDLAPGKRGTRVVSFHVPKAILDSIDELVEMGVFNNRSEAIRVALFNLVLETKEKMLEAKPVVGYR